MAIFLEGVRGSGKSKIAVAEIQTYLKANKRVVTNLDIDISKLAPNSSSELIRLPDIPRSIDFESLGYAYPELDPDNPDTYDENKFGLIVVDELLVSFNSRSWNDPDRLKLVSWFVQSRKFGWRLWLICQDVDAVDKQLRETLLQEIWACRSGKNFFSSPILGKLLNLFIIRPILKFTAPLGFHICNVYTGKRKDKTHLNQTFFFKRYDLHPAYKTAQTFLPDNMINKQGKVVDMRASYCLLKPSQVLSGEQSKPVNTEKKPNWLIQNKGLAAQVILMVGFGIGALHIFSNDSIDTITTPIEQAQNSLNTKPNDRITEQPTDEPLFSMPKPDIEGLYITCSVQENKTGSYCFEYNGKPYYPENVGFQVRYVSPCRALLTLGDNMYVAGCNPNYVPSEKPTFSDIQAGSDNYGNT